MIVKKIEISIAIAHQMEPIVVNFTKATWKVAATLALSSKTKCFLEIVSKKIRISLSSCLGAFIGKLTYSILKRQMEFLAWVKDIRSMYKIKSPFIWLCTIKAW